MAPYRRPPDAPEEVEELDLTPPRVQLPLLGRIWRAALLGRFGGWRWEARTTLVKDAKNGLVPLERVAALWAATVHERRRGPAYEALMALWREDRENRWDSGEPQSGYKHDIRALLLRGLESVACDALVLELARTLSQATTGEMAYADGWLLSVGHGEEVAPLRRSAAEVAVAGLGLLQIGDGEELARVRRTAADLPAQWASDTNVVMLWEHLAERIEEAPTEDDLPALARIVRCNSRRAHLAALRGLESVGGVGAAQALLGARDYSVRTKAHDLLVELATDVGMAPFAGLRDSDDSHDVDLYIRVMAATQVPEEDQLDLLVGAVDGPNSWRATRRLAEIGGPRAVAALIARLEAAPGWSELGDLVGMLGQLGDPEALPALRALHARGLPERAYTFDLTASLLRIHSRDTSKWETNRARGRAEAEAQLDEVIKRLERRAEQLRDPR